MADRTDTTNGIHTGTITTLNPLAVEVRYLTPGYAYPASRAVDTPTLHTGDRVIVAITPEATVVLTVIADLPTP